jgi:hypothetical protein
MIQKNANVSAFEPPAFSRSELSQLRLEILVLELSPAWPEPRQIGARVPRSRAVARRAQN